MGRSPLRTQLQAQGSCESGQSLLQAQEKKAVFLVEAGLPSPGASLAHMANLSPGHFHPWVSIIFFL